MAQRPAADAAGASAATAASAAQQQKARRRRGAARERIDRGYRYEFLDPDPESGLSPDGDGQAHTASTAGQEAGPSGFAGTATKAGMHDPAGLTSLAGDGFGGGPTVPMMPGGRQFDPG